MLLTLLWTNRWHFGGLPLHYYMALELSRKSYVCSTSMQHDQYTVYARSSTVALCMHRLNVQLPAVLTSIGQRSFAFWSTVIGGTTV